jgi:hypothetical protein
VGGEEGGPLVLLLMFWGMYQLGGFMFGCCGVVRLSKLPTQESALPHSIGASNRLDSLYLRGGPRQWITGEGVPFP